MRQKSVLSVFRQEYSRNWQRVFKILPVSLILMGFFAQSHAQMTVTIDFNAPKCAGYGGSATAIAQVSGGTAPYTYQWSNGNTSQSVFGLNAGLVTVTITDASGQSSSSSVNIAEPTELVVSLVDGGTDCYQGNTDLTAETYGGTPPYTFQWSAGGTGQTLPSPSNGFHFVTVTDANGCFKVEGKNVAGEMEVTIEANNVTCFGACDGSIGASVTGGVGPFSYQWDNGLYQSAPIQVVADVGVYNITITDANGCTVVGTSELTQPPLMEPVIDLETPCSGTTAATASVTGGTPPYNFKWSNGHFGATHPYLTEGQHHVTVTDFYNCPVETSVWVTDTDMALEVNMTDADCFGGSTGSASAITVGASGVVTYKWSNGQEGNSTTDLAPGMHKVTATDSGGCEMEKEFEIISSTGLEAEVFPTMVDCFGNMGTANAAVTGGTPPYTFDWSNGQNQQIATDLSEGTYSIMISDVHGCTGEAQVEIENLSDLEVNMVEITSSVCDATGGTAAVEVIGGVAPYSYKWNGQWTAEPTKENLTAGSNTLSVFDINGCEEVIEFEILDASMEAVVNVMNEGCPGMSNGIAEADVMTGGVAPYTFQWSNGSTSKMAENLPVGWHSVVITDANGCAETKDVEVVGVEEMQIAVDITPTACAGVESGAAHAIVNSGGTAPYTFAWSNAAQSEAIGSLGMGQYTLTVTDANGCEKEVMIDVQEEPIDVALNITSPDCANDADGMAQASILSGGTAPFTYAWSNGMSGEEAANLEPGTYILMVTDANGCEKEIPFEVAPTSTLTAEFIYGTADCDDDGVLVAFTDMSASASQGTVPTAWNWTFSDGQTSNEQNPQIMVTNAEITAELTVTNDLGCTEVMNTTVEVNVIDIALAPEHSTCHNEEYKVEITVNDNATDLVYNWSPNNLIISGQGTPNPVVATNQIGQFDLQVTIQNSTGCTKEETVSLLVEEIVEINPASVDYQQCNSLTVDFSSNNSSDVECVWYFDYPNNMDANSSASNPSYTYSAPGEYTVALLPTDENCHEPLLMPVTVTAAPEVAVASETENCQQEVEVQFLNLTDVPTGVTNFMWDFGPLGTSTEENPMMTFTEDQIIEATFTVEFGNGCVVTVEETVQVNVFNPPTLEDQFFSCNGQEVELNPNVTGDFAYHWNAPTSATISSTTDANPMATINETTTFAVTITDTDNTAGCESIQFITVEMPETILAIAPINDKKLCVDANVSLTANITGTADVQWSTDPDFTNVISTETTITVTAGEPITYYVMATSADGCAVSESALVGNFSSEFAFDGNQEICQGYFLEWTSPDVDPAEIMSWEPYNPLTTPVTESEVFTFSLDIGEDCPAYGSFELSVTPFEFTHTIQAEPAELLQGEWTQLNVTQHPDYAYTWTPTHGLSSSTIANPNAQPLQTTQYNVHVIDQETGCEGEADIQIKVEDVVCEEPYIFVPNAFTPNKDGVNDELFVRGFNIDEVYFAVYDRWGEMVFETTDLENGWDGSFKGTIVSGDVYGYYLKAVCYGGEKFFKKGNVTVLR